jgi:hypothetical protein
VRWAGAWGPGWRPGWNRWNRWNRWGPGWGWGAAGIGLGLAAASVAAYPYYASYYDDCTVPRRVFDGWGYRVVWVNVCGYGSGYGYW